MMNPTAREEALPSNGQGTTGERQLACHPRAPSAKPPTVEVRPAMACARRSRPPFGEDEHRKLGQPTDDASGRRRSGRVKIVALECLDLVPVCYEKGVCGREGNLSNVRRRIVVELLGIGTPGRGRYSQNQQPTGRKAVGGGSTLVGRGGSG
jgi:hypothetical protein